MSANSLADITSAAQLRTQKIQARLGAIDDSLRYYLSTMRRHNRNKLLLFCLAAFAACASISAAAKSEPPATYDVKPGEGVSQFPVRDAPATHAYLERERIQGLGLKLAQNYPLIDPTGRRIELSHFHGKVIVFYFWEVTCGPCIDGLPALKRLADSYRSKNVVFVAVCERDDPKSDPGHKAFLRIANPLGGLDRSSAGLDFYVDPGYSASDGFPDNRLVRADQVMADGKTMSVDYEIRHDYWWGLSDLLHNMQGTPSERIVDPNGNVVGALSGYDATTDPDMKILRHSIDVALARTGSDIQ